MSEVAEAARVRVYVCGGASAVLMGWRSCTRDIDLVVEDDDATLLAIASARDRLNISVKRTSPTRFVPPLPNWEARSVSIDYCFHHFDFYSQCLSKLERAHRDDLDDVHSMVKSGLVKRAKLRELFRDVESELYRYPVVDPPTLKSAVETFALQ